MTARKLIWQPVAFGGLMGIRTTDPRGCQDDPDGRQRSCRGPYPADSTSRGSTGLRRLRIGGARVLYEVDETHLAIHILTIGLVRG